LLAAGHDGDLVAFDADDPTGSIVWRLHTGGIVYGPPAVDPARGRIYVGANDKRLYALDARGLFLWSFATGDNVATRPVVAGDTVIFGSEDRTVYGLDAATGRLRWTRETGGPVVSSPALATTTSGQQVVVIGSDDGAAYGLDPATGDECWVHTTDEAIEAPVVADGATIYVASRAGTVSAVDAATGDVVWTAGIDGVLRTVPVVGNGRVFFVEMSGTLHALDQESGRREWSSPGAYVGPPVLVGETLIAARSDGTVQRLSLDGAPRGEPLAMTDADGQGTPAWRWGRRWAAAPSGWPAPAASSGWGLGSWRPSRSR
jgi:outer membrane protein assembly factor BamB